MPRKPCPTSAASSVSATPKQPKPASANQLPRTPDAASLIQSARRRLQYSQLPVRCSAKSKVVQQQERQRRGKLVNSLSRFTPKRCGSAKSCCVGSNTAMCRRSLSMIDLSLAANQPESIDPHIESGSNSAWMENAGDGGDCRTLSKPNNGCLNLASWVSEQELRESRAASLVGRALAINAWRRKRAHVVELKSTVANLEQQLDQLQLQIVVLRKLLDKENTRVAGIAGELHKTKMQFDDVVKDRDQLKNDKEAAEAEALRQRDISDERQVSAENLRNDLRTARDQLAAVEAQISRDREKLLKLREDKKILLDKLSSCESLASERASQMEKAELAHEDTQMQLVTQIALTNSLQEEVVRYTNLVKEKDNAISELEKTLQKFQEDNKILQEQLTASEESEKTLRLQTAKLESLILRQESKLKEIESAYEAKVLELNELQDRFLRQSQESGWSSRVLQLAGSVVRAPRVILRTLSFFSTGMPIL